MTERSQDFLQFDPNSTRLILCFLPADDTQLQEVLALARRRHKHVCVLGGPEEPKDFCRRYAPLLLDDEFLIAIEAPPQEVLGTVEALRASGKLSIFVFRDDLAGLKLLILGRRTI